MHQTNQMQDHQTRKYWWQNYGGAGLPSITTFSAAKSVCLALSRADSVALVDLLEKKPAGFTRGFVSAALSISIALLGSCGGRFAANH
jgi:hypothetical protein